MTQTKCTLITAFSSERDPHIVANWLLIYLGKESDKHWEEGEDLSLMEFKGIEYKRKGYLIATDEQLDNRDVTPTIVTLEARWVALTCSPLSFCAAATHCPSRRD